MRPLHWLIAGVGAGFIHLALAVGFVIHGNNPVDSTISAANQGVRIQLSMQGLDQPAAEQAEKPAPEPLAKTQPTKPAEEPTPKRVEPEPELKAVAVNIAKVDVPTNAVLIQLDEPEKLPAPTIPDEFPVAPDTPGSSISSTSKTLNKPPEDSPSGSQSVQETAEYTSAKNSYFARLMGTLQRNKRYPKEAKKKKEQGTVMLQFSINKRGDVIAANIAESSGHLLLDEAALQMLRKASPLPSIPDSLAQQQLEITIPVEYSLITK